MSRIDNNSYYFNPNDNIDDTQGDVQYMEGRVLVRGYNSSTKLKVFDNSGTSIFGVDTTSPRVDVYTPNFYINGSLYSGGSGFDPTANLTIYGANNANKFLIENNSGTDIFNVNTSTPVINIGTNIIPFTNNSQSIGSSSFRLSNLFTTLLNASSTSTLNGISNSGSYTQSGTSQNTFTGLINLNTNGTAMNVLSQNSSSGVMFNINNGASSGGIYYENNGTDTGLILTSKVFPNLDITHDLGTLTRRWNTIFINGINNSGGYTQSGSSNNSFSGILNLNVNGTSLNLNNTSSVTGIAFFANSGADNASMLYSSAGFTYNATLMPSSSLTYNLGSSSQRWNTFFGSQIDVLSSITSSSAST